MFTLYAAGYLLVLLTVTGFHLGGYWNYLVPVFVFVLVPILDAAFPLNHHNPGQEERKRLESSWRFKVITHLYALIQPVFLIWCLVMITTTELPLHAYIGFLLSTGLTTGGIGITMAHELLHKRSRLEQALGDILLLTVCYPHFSVEHVYGHHRWVATPRDPATARKGQSFYRFYPQTVFGSYASAWRINAEHLSRKQRGFFSFRNRMFVYHMLQALIMVTIILWFGWSGFVFFILQAIIAFSLLELVNYVEHYGLLRKQMEPDVFERVTPTHSWNTDHRVSNWLLINLQRHSDHHVIATRRFQALQSYPESPQLPAGYPAMVLLALVPPLWFQLIHPLLESRTNR